MGVWFSFSISDWYSAVGMFFRDASSCVSASTCLSVFAFFAIGSAPLPHRNGLYGRGIDDLGELLLDPGREVALHGPDVGQLRERPSAPVAAVVHAGHPIRLHRRLFLLRVFAAITLDLDDEAQQITVSAPVVDEDDE